MLVCGVDTSTQSCTVEVRDARDGRLVGRASAPHPPTTPPVSEQDPEAWWTAFQQCLATLGAPPVEAISVAGQQHGLVPLGADREVLRPALLWNDTRAAADADWLHARLEGGRTAWATAVGSVPLAAFTVSKLSWLHRSEPETWERLTHVVLPHDWMTMRLTGELVTDRGDASGTGYWSPASGEYRFDLLELVDAGRDWSAALPRVLGPREVAGTWGAAVVASGTGDNMAAALTLAPRDGEVVVSLGTSGTAYTVSTTPTADATGAVAGFADATGSYLPLVCTLNAGKVLDAVRRLLGMDLATFERSVAAGPSDGLTVLPYLDGERTPDRPDATGWISGLRSTVEPRHLARAAVEGVVCGMLDAVDALAAVTRAEGSILLTGGVARSSAVCSVFAALAERQVETAVADEAVATGAALQAASVLLDVAPDQLASAWGLAERRPVSPDRHDVAGVRERYATLREAAVG